jgi:two-component system sensor histidine kinase KdpD
MAGDLLIKLALAALERTQAAARQVAIKAMEDTDRLRTALLSSISHDFRTPLATITASASSLMAYGETFTERTRSDLLSSIQEEAERLSRFVGNVLDMTRLEAGVLKTRAEWTDPLELIENVRDRVEKRAASHEISVTAPAALPAIEVDPVLLEQALVNVIDNALIHTPAGSRIEIGSTHAGSTVRLWVEDSGAGVDPAELKQIFDKFYRPAGSGHAAGLGLGLAITKALVEAMDGTVSASGAANGESGLRIEFAFRATSVSEVA